MFSAISSYLPSLLPQSPPPTSPSSMAVPDDPTPTIRPSPQPVPHKKKAEKPLSYETFTIVRPASSRLSTHVLQVQLIPPTAANGRAFAAIAPSTPVDDSTGSTDIARTPSMNSGYTSASSVSSFSSTSSTSSMRSKIPLYDLHSGALANFTLKDAGTDDKIAKYVKRGVDILNVASLDLIEVRGSCTSDLHPYLDHRRDVNPLRPPAINLTLAPNDPRSNGDPQPQRKRFLSRMFKKKDDPQTLSIAVPRDRAVLLSPASIALDSHPLSPPRDGIYDVTLLSATDSSFHDRALSPALAGDVPSSNPTVLGVHPTISANSDPRARPTKYVWVVRRWLMDTDSGLLNGMFGKLSLNGRTGGAAADPAPGSHVEVVFEWKRKKKRHGRDRDQDRSRHRRRKANTHTNGAAIRDSGIAPSPSPSTHDLISGEERHSLASHRSSHSEALTSDSGHLPPGPPLLVHPPTSPRSRNAVLRDPVMDHDSGEESDPEDSETPWTCTLSVRPLAGHALHIPTEASNGVGHPMDVHTPQPSPTPHAPHTPHYPPTSPPGIHLKVATLRPVPHHPNAVGLLRMSYPQPDIAVEQMKVGERVFYPSEGTMEPTLRSDAGLGLLLTAEQIKDTASATAVWLVMRECFGGIGKDKHKAEGRKT